MRTRPTKADDAAELLRRHYQAISGLVAAGADEPTVGAALTAAEGAGLDRVALRQAVREGALDRERRAEVATELDHYRAMLDRPDPAPAVEAVPAGQRAPHTGPKGGELG